MRRAQTRTKVINNIGSERSSAINGRASGTVRANGDNSNRELFFSFSMFAILSSWLVGPGFTLVLLYTL